MQFQSSTLAILALAFIPKTFGSPTPPASIATNTTLTETVGLAALPQYCSLNLHYCGWNLINSYNEDYRTRISNKLCQLGITCDYNSANIWNSLWNCGADLEFLGLCGGDYSCINGGSGRHDYCKA